MAKRDIKNIAEDVKYLEQIGLVEKKATDHKTKPVIDYDKIALEIVVGEITEILRIKHGL